MMALFYYENFAPTRLVTCSVNFESLECCDHDN